MPQPKKFKQHECIAMMNKTLEKDSVSLDVAANLMNGQQFMRVQTRWIDNMKPKRGAQLPVLIPSYCPFCGENLQEKNRWQNSPIATVARASSFLESPC